MKAHIKARAVSLRASGHSFAEISRLLDISKNTASLWTRNIEVSPLGLERMRQRSDAGRRKSNDTARHKKTERLELARTEAGKLTAALCGGDLYGVAVLAMIYQCEGMKNDNAVRFTNSDPDMIRLFMSLFRSSFPIDESRIRVRLHLHDYHNEGEMKRFWSDITGIPAARFSKTFWKQSDHKYIKQGYKGCAHITYGDAHIARVILAVAKDVMRLYTTRAIG